MNIRVREKEEVAIFDLEGNIDINSSDFIESVGWTLVNRTKNILCNFEGINLVDYIGISIIAVVYKNVLNHKGVMKFYNVPAHVKKLYSIVGIDRVLDIYETEEQALESFKEESVLSQILDKQLRRRFKRIKLGIIIEYKQKFSHTDTFYKGKVLNLSGDGTFVKAEKIFSIGELLKCRLHLLPKPGVIELDVKVVWVTDEVMQYADAPGMGLEFYNIIAKKQEEIIEFVERHLTHSVQE